MDSGTVFRTGATRLIAQRRFSSFVLLLIFEESGDSVKCQDLDETSPRWELIDAKSRKCFALQSELRNRSLMFRGGIAFKNSENLTTMHKVLTKRRGTI